MLSTEKDFLPVSGGAEEVHEGVRGEGEGGQGPSEETEAFA